MRAPRLITFTVEGRGEFPFDMLRYDACWPKSEGADSGQLSSHASRARRRVVLQTHSAHAPTVGRWESFSWHVMPGECREPEVFTPSPWR